MFLQSGIADKCALFQASACPAEKFSIGRSDFGILRAVIRSSRNHLLCCLFAMMFVMLRTADAHAHFCFDGKEPPTSIHVADGESHPCETDPSQGHTGDKDVKLSPDVFVKKPIPSDVWVPFAISFVFQFALQPVDEPTVDIAPTADSRPPLFRVPPLRGPPV